MTDKKSSEDSFVPVPVKPRHDGWHPDKQVKFIEALAECGCVQEALQRVGMGRAAAYALRARPEAIAFRLAWDAALDVGIRALADAAFSRALHGVARPVFYKGEQVGERRYYDERLTMFLLRCRDPARYGAWLDRTIPCREQDQEADLLAGHLDRLSEEAWGDYRDQQRPLCPYPPTGTQLASEQARADAMAPQVRIRRGG